MKLSPFILASSQLLPLPQYRRDRATRSRTCFQHPGQMPQGSAAALRSDGGDLSTRCPYGAGRSQRKFCPELD
jgi:hypothetical protein